MKSKKKSGIKSNEGETDKNQWMAKVKVLAELVEHHIHEEEGEMFKAIEMPSGRKAPKDKRFNHETERFI